MFNANFYLGKNTDYPKHNIDPKKKDQEWYRKFAEAAYSDYINNKLTIPFSNRDEIDLLRLYAQGNQPVNKYKDRLAPVDKRTNKRKGYMNVSWDILSVVPKFKRVVMGMLEKMEYDVFVDALNEKAIDQKLDMKWRLWAEKDVAESLGQEVDPNKMTQISGMPGYIPNSIEQLQMMQELGAFKLPLEIAYEMCLKWSFDMSYWDDIKRRLYSDLFDIGIACARDYVDPVTKRVKSRYVDPKNALISYSSDPTHKNMRLAGEMRKLKIAELREKAPELTDEQINEIAEKYRNFDNNYSDNTGNLGISPDNYEEYDIMILEMEFLDYDLNKYEKKKTSRGDDRIYAKDFDYKKKATAKRTPIEVKKKKVRKVSWVIGTKFVYDYGEATDIPKNDSEEICLSYKVYRESDKSILASIVPIADNIQITWLKLQNAIAMSAPSGLKVEVGSLSNISVGGKKMKPLDILQIYRQTGDVLYKANTHQSQFTGSQPAPVDRIVGGIGPELNEYITLFNHDIEVMRQITGISPAMDASTLSTETPVGTSKMQVGATNNVMHNIFIGYKCLKEQISKNMATRWQVRVRFGGVKGLEKAIGPYYAKVLKMSGKNDLEDLGIILHMRPSDQEKNELKQIAINSSNTKKQGGVGISMADYMYVSRLIDNGNLKLAQSYLAVKESQEQQRQEQIQQQLEQQRQEGAAQLAQQKMEGDMQTYGQKKQMDTESEIAVETAKSDLRDKERGNKAMHDENMTQKQHFNKLDEELIKSGNKTLGQ